jgi:hypothetical protein
MLGPVGPATFPDEPVTSPRPSHTTPSQAARIRGIVRHPQLTAALLAILIGFASVFSAVIAWRASIASIDASRYQSLAVQQQARQEQIERELEGTVEQDQRFVTDYQEHSLAARQLQTQADSLRTADATAADALDVQAQSEAAQARALQPFFMGAGGVTADKNGNVAYDKTFVLTSLENGDVELRELKTSNVADLAQRADNKSIDLVGIAAIVVAALFFLTIAQVSRTRARVRQLFFVAGGLMVLAGAAGYVLVELLT